MTRRPTICFDLDGTLADYSDGWQGVEKIGKPLLSGTKLLKRLSTQCTIIIYTCRTNAELNSAFSQAELVAFVQQWFTEHQLPYNEIYVGLGKPQADVYIDDRAVHFQARSNVDYAMKAIRRITHNPTIV